MPRRRQRPVAASAEANIVLPRAGVTTTLPPPPSPEVEPPKPKLPPGTRNTRMNLTALKAKARRQSLSLEKVQLDMRVDLVMYEALIDLAEEYNMSMAEMARQCLRDGIRRYRDFNSSYDVDSPFRKTTPMQAFGAEIVAPVARDRPTTGKLSPVAVYDRRAALTAEDLTGPLPGYDAEVDERNNAGLAAMAQQASARLGMFLPQSPPLKAAEEMAYDALAPVPEADDPGTVSAEALGVADD